jgi:hypothetical protein
MGWGWRELRDHGFVTLNRVLSFKRRDAGASLLKRIATARQAGVYDSD